ncbi:MAG: hypothetical protein F6K58_13290 [Symploca sp. SIO2E9]|nr:hypothetical protein [Symploca sp. SIO2E9]
MNLTRMSLGITEVPATKEVPPTPGATLRQSIQWRSAEVLQLYSRSVV